MKVGLVEKDTSKMSDSEYWKQYEQTDHTGINHDIDIDIAIKFKASFGDQEIYEIKQKNINCNTTELAKFFDNLKKTIRMLDETKVKHEINL